MMRPEAIIKSILWAIDPLTKDKTAQETVPKAIKALIRSPETKIYPISVILEEQIPYLAGPNVTKADFRSHVEASVNQWINQFQLPNIEPWELIVEPSFSIKAAATTLSQVCLRKNCDFIICTTHAKPRARTMELGTFSESLFLLAQCSLFLVHPQGRIPDLFQEVFFPTDLSAVSLASLDLIVPTLKSLGSHLTLFHKSIHVSKDIIELPMSGDAKSQYISQKQIEKTFSLQQIKNQLTKEGIQVDLILDNLNSEYISQSITTRANALKNGFIAMASHSQNLPGSIPGSITRQVLRNTELPVWVLHPQSQRENLHGMART